MNYATESRTIFIKGIEDNKNIPEETKKELIGIISSQFLIMSQYVGTMELMYLRETQPTLKADQ